MYMPEPRLDPPEYDFFLCQECDGEVYEGEVIFEWDGKWICEDCYREKFEALSLVEIAAMRGDDYDTVAFPKRGRCYV